MPLEDFSKSYERKLQQQILDFSKKIRSIYYRSINEISLYASVLKQFNPDNSPALKKKIEKVLASMQSSIQVTITDSIRQAWDLSNKKNDIINDDIIGDKPITQKEKNLLYNPNAGALVQFYKRVENGLNLSDRVWNLVEPYRFELEAGLADGIGKGKSAASMASAMKLYLNEPDRLFRRVRDEKGKLQLSRAAKAFHPGQGVYRSSFKNALRLTATETNISYRSSDHERWKNNPLITAIDIKLSNAHDECDMCNYLVGRYPADYKHIGFHIRCLCFSVPVLITDEQFRKQRQFRLGLIDKEPTIKRETEIPARAKEWLKKNAKRMAGWKNQPALIEDNKQYVSEFLK